MKTYPQAPGYKGEAETSQQAAKRVESSAEVIRREMLRLIGESPKTHDECAVELRPIFITEADFQNFKRSVRSRGSELKAAGKIEDSGQRRTNESGSPAVVWRIKQNQTAKVITQQTTETKTYQQQLL